MTHEILESDIELAKTLVRDGLGDSEILAVLIRRGLDAGDAAELISDLRLGRPVSVTRAMTLLTRPTQTPPEPNPASGVDAVRAVRRGDRTTRDRSSGRGAGFFALASVGLGGVVVGVLLAPYLHRNEGSTASLLPLTANATARIPAPPVAEKGPAEAHPPSAPLCELQVGPDGVNVCNSRVTRDSVLQLVSQCLGPATRTNRIAESQLVYAFDHQGVLIYAQPGGEKSLVVDFHGRGGEHGTKAPFWGVLKIGDTTIDVATDAKHLTEIEKLELNDAGTDGSLFGGKYGNLELFFAYRGNSDRLQLVQIELK